MSKKGFTLVELLATIVIMGIIIAIAVPSYFNITQSTKEKAYESKKEYIEAKAISYASENDLDPATITVADLINAGYIEADSDGKFSNPLGGYLDCYQIAITRNNGEYIAELTKTEAKDENGNCIIDNNNELTIVEYSYDLSKKQKGSKIKKDTWTNQDVMLHAYLSKYPNIKTVKWMSGTTIDTNREEYVSASVFLNSKYTVEVTLDDGTVRTGSYNVKIDKEKPIVTGSVDNVWTKYGKIVTLIGSDGDGSGIKGFYISKNQSTPNIDNFTNNGYEIEDDKVKIKLDVGSYYAYTIDNANNISDSYNLVVSNIDKIGPKCKYPNISDLWTNKDVSITYGCESDSQSGCKTTDISKSYSDETTETLNWQIEDNVGKTTNCSFPVHILIDKTVPTISYIKKTLALGKEDYDFIDNITSTCGHSTCTIKCNPEVSKKTGQYNVTCKITNKIGVSAATSFAVRHSFAATYVKKTCTRDKDTYTYECCNGTGYPCTQLSCDGVPYHCYNVPTTCCNKVQCTGHHTEEYDCSVYVCPKGTTKKGKMCEY
jgi:type IV pilus assembly protein PilA